MNAIVLALFSGINFAFAILSFIIYHNNTSQKFYFYFGLFNLFSGFYFLLNVISGYVNFDIRWLIILCAGIYYGVFPWVLFEYVRVKHHNFLRLLSSVFAAAILIFIVNPDPDNFAIWQILAHIGLIGLMVAAVYATIVLIQNKRSGAMLFGFISALFVLLGLEEIISNYSSRQLLSGYFTGILPLDLYPLLFTLIIGTRLSNEVFAKNRLKIQLIESKLNEEKLKLEEFETEKLQEKLHSKSKDLTDFGIEITRKKEFTENIYDKLTILKKEIKTKSTELNELISFIKSHIQIDRELDHFQKNIDSINNEFVSRLRNDCPSLTNNELQLASLLRLKFNTKEIAVIKNISPDSVKVLRYRIRKKLNLSTHQGLSQFMQELD